MRRKRIGLYCDTEIDYKFILSLNEVVEIKEDLLGFDLIIIDVLDFDKSKLQLLMHREYDQKVPIIWIVDPTESMEAISHLRTFDSLGRIHIEYRNSADYQGILQSVALVLNPDLPTKRLSMDLFIPVFNEVHRIKHVREFAIKLKSLHKMGYPYISIYFIDDGSNDDSDKFLQDMIDAYFEETDSVEYKAAFRILKLPNNTRKAGTYMEAFKVATSDVIIFADADNAFNLVDITKLINIVNQGFYDIVIGTKDKTAEDRPLIRDFVSTVKRILTKPLLPKGVTDSQTGLKLFRGSVVKPVLAQLDVKYGLAIDLKIIYEAKKMNLRVLEVPVFFKDREGSHIDVIADSARFLKNMVKISLGM